MAKVLFGLQQIITAGNKGDLDGVFRGNEIVTTGIKTVIPRAGHFACLAGAASTKRGDCSA